MEDDRDLPCYLLLQYHNRYEVWKMIWDVIAPASKNHNRCAGWGMIGNVTFNATSPRV